MKRRDVLILLGTVFLELLIAFSPLLPLTESFWDDTFASSSSTGVVAVVGMSIAVLAAGLLLSSGLERSDRQSFERDLLRRIEGCSARWIREEEFYRDFRTAVKSARDRVLVTYLGNDSPDSYPSDERRKYYREFADDIRGNQQAQFRRIMRNTKPNRAWLRRHLEELRDVMNASVVIIDEGPDDVVMPHALSCQVVDNEHGWLVAIRVHEGAGQPRDLYTDCADLIEALVAYHDRLWLLGTELLRNGRLTDAGLQFLESGE